MKVSGELPEEEEVKYIKTLSLSAVQPRRDPTGSQKDRRKRVGGPNPDGSLSGSPQERSSNSFSSDGPTPTGSYIIEAIKSDYGFVTPRRVSTEYVSSPDRYGKHVKLEVDEEPVPSTSTIPDKVCNLIMGVFSEKLAKKGKGRFLGLDQWKLTNNRQ